MLFTNVRIFDGSNEKLMAGGADNRYVTGEELVSILMRADEFNAERTPPPVQVPQEQ